MSWIPPQNHSREIRSAERRALQEQHDRELTEALDYLRTQAQAPPEQSPSEINDAARPQMAEQAQPESTQPDFQPQPEAADAAVPEADRELAKLLQDNPRARDRIARDFATVHEQATAHVQAAQANYAQGVTAAVSEVQAIFGTLFPELAGINNPEQLRGAVAVMAAQNPQRVEQLKQFYSRAQNVMAAQQQIQQAERQAAMERADLFRQMEVKRFEAATAHIPEETMKTLRASVLPTVENFYGITEPEMRALTTCKQKVDSYTFMHSLPFQLMLMDAVMSQDAISRAAVRPVPQVQRPGVSEPSKGDEGEISAALARFNREGGNMGRDGLRNAAAVVAARRARS